MTTQRLTTQHLHNVIQNKIGVLSSKVSVAQRVFRQTYDINTSFKGFYGIMSGDSDTIQNIKTACAEAGLTVDSAMISRGFIKVSRFN